MRLLTALRRPHILSKRDLLRVGSFVLVIWGSLFTGVLALVDLPRLSVLSLAATVAVILIGWVQGFTQSTVVTANLLMLTLYAGVTSIAYWVREDLSSPWFLLVPLVATMVGGLRSAAFWTALVLVQGALPYPSDAMAWLRPPIPVPEETTRLLEIFGFTGALLCVLCLVSVYELFRVQAEAGLQTKNQALAQALEEVKWLQGILPICMHCRRVRSETSSWQGLDKYLDSHSQLRFSHGLCDECLKQHYPEQA